MIRLETERLVIRDHVESDLEGLFSLISRPLEMRYLPEIFASTLDAARENLLVSLSENGKDPRGKYFWALLERGNGAYVGEIGFTVLERHGSGLLADFGYFIKSEYWNRGYVTEASRACIDFAFSGLGAWKIQMTCCAENAASERVMVKLGFVNEGKLRKHQFSEGVWKDRLCYGMLRDEWPALTVSGNLSRFR